MSMKNRLEKITKELDAINGKGYIVVIHLDTETEEETVKRLGLEDKPRGKIIFISEADYAL